MKQYTITSTVNKNQLPSLLAEIKSIVGAEQSMVNSYPHIKTVHVGSNDRFCKVTVKHMPKKAVLH
jgi:hypothetical protein